MKRPPIALFLIPFAFCATLAGQLKAADAKPNVLFLAVDDMNDWIGCLETRPRAITPNIDRLAARGVNFSNAHTAGVFCAPSRAAIFSGQYASTTGCYMNANYFVGRPEIEALQMSFAKAGYTTLGAGKLFHHPEGAIDQRGWTEFFLRNRIQRENGWPLASWSSETPVPQPFPASVYNKGKKFKAGLFLEWGPIPNEKEEALADTIRVNWAVKQLKKKHDKPFFLACGLYAPHFPNYCPQKYFDLYDAENIELPEIRDDDLTDLPPKIRKVRENRKRLHHDKLARMGAVDDAIHGYLACISYADAMLGRVLDALQASPYADNTIVVLWSDHGYHHGEKGQWGKHTLWERTSNVPFVWAGPGVAKGAKTDVTVSLIDIYPTLAELCDLPQPAQRLEGKSLVSTLHAPSSAQDRSVYLPYMKPGEYAIINRDWRYIRYGDDGEELYDLRRDPHEWNNLASDSTYAERKAALRKLAPSEFAPPQGKLNARRDLVIEGETFRWEKGKGNYKPIPKYRPYTEKEANVQRANKSSKAKTLDWTKHLGSLGVPKIDNIQRGEKPLLPASRWPAALNAVRNNIKLSFPHLKLQADRRNPAGAESSHLLRYGDQNTGLELYVLGFQTPREAGEALRRKDRLVSLKTFSLRTGSEFRLQDIGDEAYRYQPRGAVSLCYSNVFVLIKGTPSSLPAQAAKVVVDSLKKAAEPATSGQTAPQFERPQE